MKYFWYLVFISIILTLGYYSWGLVVQFATFFSGASDSVKAASIAGVIFVFVILVVRFLEKSREFNAAFVPAKIACYQKFFAIYFGL